MFTSLATAKALFTSIKTYLILAVVVAVGFYIHILQQENEQLTKQLDESKRVVGQLEQSNAGMKDTIEKIRADSIEQQAKIDGLNEDLNSIELQNRELTDRFKKAEGRQEVVFKKPKLVERMMERSVREYVDRYSCLTGAEERCRVSRKDLFKQPEYRF